MNTCTYLICCIFKYTVQATQEGKNVICTWKCIKWHMKYINPNISQKCAWGCVACLPSWQCAYIKGIFNVHLWHTTNMLFVRDWIPLCHVLQVYIDRSVWDVVWFWNIILHLWEYCYGHICLEGTNIYIFLFFYNIYDMAFHLKRMLYNVF